MPLQRIDYANLSPRQKKVYNFQKVAAILADYGFNCIRSADDCHEADFVARHLDGITNIRVQLKTRLLIGKKYQNKNLHMAFPTKKGWHLIPHDRLVDLVSEHCNWLNTRAWNDDGLFHSHSPSKVLLEAIDQYRLDCA